MLVVGTGWQRDEQQYDAEYPHGDGDNKKDDRRKVNGARLGVAMRRDRTQRDKR